MNVTQKKELRASPPTTILPLATWSSSQLLGQTPNLLLRSLQQAKTAGKGVDMLEHVSFLFQKGHRKHERNGFLHFSLRVDGL